MSDEYISEQSVGDGGLITKLLKTPDGVLVSRSLVDQSERELERVDYNPSGQAIARTVYLYDDGDQPLETKAYDGAGEIVFIKKRNQPPLFFGKHQAGKPPFMCA